MSRYLYNANVVALGGTLVRPFQQNLDAHCACVLPQTGGKVTAASRAPFELRDPATGNLILSFLSSESSVEGIEDGNAAKTIVHATVRGLDVLGVLTISEITSHVETTVDRSGTRQVSMAGSAFRAVSIGGETFDIAFDDALAAEAADYPEFRKKHGHIPESKGRTMYSLAKNDKLKNEPENYGYYKQPDFGTIYFAEWVASPDRQTLNLLRLQLGSPAAGKIVIVGTDSNGTWMP